MLCAWQTRDAVARLGTASDSKLVDEVQAKQDERALETALTFVVSLGSQHVLSVKWYPHWRFGKSPRDAWD